LTKRESEDEIDVRMSKEEAEDKVVNKLVYEGDHYSPEFGEE
jgi:hypothetical protein